MQDGRILTALIHRYPDLREEFLGWAASHDYPEPETLVNYRRALIAWYEARTADDDPYRGDPMDFIISVAKVYFGKDHPPPDRPLRYFPRSINLPPEGQSLLRAFHQLEPGCRELLLLADYHRLSTAAIARAVGDDEEPVTARIAVCRRELEASSPSAPRYWSEVITVAGRQDLMQTLEREEQRLTTDQLADESEAQMDEKREAVRLTPRRRLKLRAPAVGTVVAAVIFGVFMWLVYDTFGNATPDGLYARYFEPYPNIFRDSVPTTEDERDLQRILYYYDRGDYRTAYDELLPAARAYPAASLYLGVTALALGDPGRAGEWFGRVDPLGPYADVADWYRALASLAGQDLPRARRQLVRIRDDVSHPYRDRAAEILADLY
ncbi:tol-pal system YbgF family protein [Lewinella sp. JB7]|uniref:tetratricopeptide repeat protein n=1 Tax=Lewinella sp. JB7 TaxID=2962887 RepID=UPI0020CA0F00|nr:hypothetical protein [Lewinella sp. JB7]MCP9236964.1 hypothetical protein [Lewinella sp. JB7]